MSNFAFGTYRISDYNLQHIEALKEAIKSGVTMIDTSPNYMDGSAQRAVALALREFDESKRQDIEIISKFGYIQGSNMQKHKERPFDEVVEFNEDCYHCISQSFLQDQLEVSMSNLEVDKIDCYMIQNPEYYLIDAINNGIDEDDRLDEMYRRIYKAFVALEEEIKAGNILSYGISSNSFALSQNNEEFLPYKDLITLAQDASVFVGNKIHSFTTIELPINLLEREGLKCASWAKENGLRVLANRPLNAKKDNLMYRLADYDESREYYHHFNELMEVCDNDVLKSLYNLLDELDASKHKFGWIGDYEAFFYAQVVPHIKKSLEPIDDANRETMFNLIDLFFQEYRKMVAHECSKNTRVTLKEYLSDCNSSLQECAIKFLMQQNSIDFILVGMRKPLYVHDIISLKA